MSKKDREQAIKIEQTLNQLSFIDQLIWLKNNYPKSTTRMVQRRKQLFDYVMTNVPSLCDNKSDLSYCIFWILDNQLSKNIQRRCANDKCNSILTYRNYKNLLRGYSKFCSPKCSATSNETRIKCKCTCINKLGVDSPAKSKLIKAKIAQTKQEKYGNSKWNNREQAVKTEKQKAIDDPLYFYKKSQKVKNTKQKKYGNPNYINKEQIALTHAKNHNGIDHNFKDPECKARRKLTWLKKYGCEHPSQNRSIRLKQQNRYIYNGIHFDTSPEIALYIYCVDNNIDFEYQPNIYFKYSYNGIEHRYFPDFLIQGQFIEIKGSHFFKKDGTMRNPFDKSQDGLYEAKHQCMINNNVKILKENEYIKYIIYVKTKYGKHFLKQFKKVQ